MALASEPQLGPCSFITAIIGGVIGAAFGIFAGLNLGGLIGILIGCVGGALVGGLVGAAIGRELESYWLLASDEFYEGLPSEADVRIQELSDKIVSELVSLAPESMTEIQFEIVSAPGDRAEIGLIENHPAVRSVELSEEICRTASRYLPLMKQYVPGWSRSLFILCRSETEWSVQIDVEGH